MKFILLNHKQFDMGGLNHKETDHKAGHEVFLSSSSWITATISYLLQ